MSLGQAVVLFSVFIFVCVYAGQCVSAVSVDRHMACVLLCVCGVGGGVINSRVDTLCCGDKRFQWTDQ